MAKRDQHSLRILIVGVVGTLVLYHVPWAFPLAYPLLLISTVAHEMGHGLAALLLGGHFHSLQMQPDGSGLATWSGVSNPIAIAMIAAAGLLGPAVVAAVGFRLSRHAGSSRPALAMAGLACLLSVLLVVRGLFAVAFIGTLGLILGVLAKKASAKVCQFTLTFLSVQLSLSCYARSDYLFVKYAAAGPSDVEVIAQNLLLPYWFWGGGIAFLSFVILLVGLKPYWSRR